MKRKVKELLASFEFSMKSGFWYSRMLVFFSFFARKHSPKNTYHFLLPPPGNGNVGDQAMVDSFINHLGIECVLIVEDKHKFKSTNRFLPESKIVEIPNLIFGTFFQNMSAIYTLLKLSREMKSFSVIGADVMDGYYNVRESVNRLFLLRVINLLGIETRITGFSWSPNAKDAATDLLRKISTQTKLCVRDPNSVRRLNSLRISTVTEVADLVFADDSLEFAANIQSWLDSSDKPFVTVNISGLGVQQNGEYSAHVSQYKLVVDALRIKGYRILILPHVFRVGDGDLKVSADLFETSCTSEDLLIIEPLTPAQERQMLKAASFVITGRMHVSILALSVGKPVIALETAGKVQGLFDLFELGNYCLVRTTEFGEETVQMINLLEQEYSTVCQLIQKKIPEIRQLSLLNFTGMDLL
jgi:colanic acid/amylovoran biosynthesis protein